MPAMAALQPAATHPAAIAAPTHDVRNVINVPLPTVADQR
jgi:hypothetical protein